MTRPAAAPASDEKRDATGRQQHRRQPDTDREIVARERQGGFTRVSDTLPSR
jgi:hypothetical protein